MSKFGDAMDKVDDTHVVLRAAEIKVKSLRGGTDRAEYLEALAALDDATTAHNAAVTDASWYATSA